MQVVGKVKFANLNMFKSQRLHDRIVYERIQNRNHLKLCNEMFLHQHQYRRHAHLKQPEDSTMLDQKELQEFAKGSFQSVFDMCRIGKLRLPQREKYLRKRTSVLTTSGYMDFHLHQKFCKGDHEHEPIQGTMRHEGKRVNMSSYAAAYTSSFGKFVARVILEECQLKEPPVACCGDLGNQWDTLAARDDHPSPDMAPEDSPDQKRRRHGI